MKLRESSLFPGYFANRSGKIYRIDKQGKRVRVPPFTHWKRVADGSWKIDVCYVNITTTINGSVCHTCTPVGRIVASAFHGSPPNPMAWAVHKNGKMSDNRAANLYWKTPSYATGVQRALNGTLPAKEPNTLSHLTEKRVMMLRRERMKHTCSMEAFAKKHKVALGACEKLFSRFSHR